MPTVAFRGTRAELSARLRQAALSLSGGAADQGGGVADLLRALGAEALACVREGFAEKSAGGADAAGVSWAPPAPGTARAKARKGQAAAGVASGRLLASLTPGAPGNRLEAGPGSVTCGSAVPHSAHFHARRPLWPEVWPEAWARRLAGVLNERLGRVLARTL